MTTKEEILKLSKEQLKKLYLKVPVKRDNSNCSDCFNCSYCTSQKGKKYMILDVQLTKEEYENKMKALGGGK